MKTETYKNYSKSINSFDQSTQKKLLLLLTKHLTCDDETKNKFTTALNAFTKLNFEDKKREIHVWISTMENILKDGKKSE